VKTITPTPKPDASEDGLSKKALADALHAVIASDRTIYTQEVVHRLDAQEAVVGVSEHRRDNRALQATSGRGRNGHGWEAKLGVATSP
jgi:hypothetical protein